MRTVFVGAVLVTFVFAAACSKPEPAPASGTNASAPAAASSPNAASGATTSSAVPAARVPLKAKTDACALLSSAEVKSIQGEAVKETRLTARADGGFAISQCFYTLPTFTNSISLAVTERADVSGARDPKEFWKETFRQDSEEVKREREKAREREKERDRDKAKPRDSESEEEEEGTPPKPVKGVGDEAYWMASQVGGSLYVLKGNSYVRLSVGGTANEAARIKKLKALAQKVVSRLS